jgi:hypothetical protein
LFTYENDLAAFCAARDRGELCEVNAEMYDYFLEVLPPVHMGRTVTLCNGKRQFADFEFAEGAERITAFWEQHPEPGVAIFYAQHTNEIARG